VKPGRREVPGLVGQEHPVGGHREILDSRFRRQEPDQLRQVAADQRLASGQAHAVDSQAGEDVDQKTHLFEVEDVRPGKPDVVLLRHAVLAPQVAPIRHRNPKIPERATEGVENGHA
jgi:hypothetical protein